MATKISKPLKVKPPKPLKETKMPKTSKISKAKPFKRTISSNTGALGSTSNY